MINLCIYVLDLNHRYVRLGNPISGGGEGDDILSLFRGFLNPIQVIRLSKKSLRSDFQWIPPQSKIIVAGGDGSVSAVLSAIANSKKKVFKLFKEC